LLIGAADGELRVRVDVHGIVLKRGNGTIDDRPGRCGQDEDQCRRDRTRGQQESFHSG
jgi:hypothetical protein